jgi:hypothetical protein
MVRRKKDQPPMKTYPVRMSEELHAEMQEIAIARDISDSEYIRQAIKAFNAIMKPITAVDSTHKNNTVSNPQLNPVKQYVPDAVEIAKEQLQQKPLNNTVSKPTMVKPLTKGGK